LSRRTNGVGVAADPVANQVPETSRWPCWRVGAATFTGWLTGHPDAAMLCRGMAGLEQGWVRAFALEHGPDHHCLTGHIKRSVSIMARLTAGLVEHDWGFSCSGSPRTADGACESWVCGQAPHATPAVPLVSVPALPGFTSVTVMSASSIVGGGPNGRRT
jgi:hypothetical protein